MFLENSFDSVVFCLMLDYLPTCQQRLHACRIAQKLLRCLGLLLIIEPDSSLKDGRQKCWRQALEKIGFGLVNYMKSLNIHCLAFRKLRMIENHENDEEVCRLLKIPQDDIVFEDKSIDLESNHISADKTLFDELPHYV